MGSSVVQAKRQSETAFSPALSTKLSTGTVDKNKKRYVFLHLADLLMFYMRLMVQRMIFLCRMAWGEE
jgi:hypothetical protein